MPTRVANSTTTDGATVITVPAGEYTFSGKIILTAAQNEVLNTAAAIHYPSITVANSLEYGAGPTEIATVAVATPAIPLTGVSLSSSTAVIDLDIQLTSSLATDMTFVLNVNGASGAKANIYGSY